MKVLPTRLPGVLMIEPRVYTDARGAFVETWNRGRYADAGVAGDFVQDNQSCSLAGVLRGLHYQIERPQGKLVWVIQGEIYDVAVDLRRSSPNFCQWTSVLLSAENHLQLYIPEGLAHGFCVTAGPALVAYKCTEPYAPQLERTILWSDPELAIDWPLTDPTLSDKDRAGLTFAAAPKFA